MEKIRKIFSVLISAAPFIAINMFIIYLYRNDSRSTDVINGVLYVFLGIYSAILSAILTLAVLSSLLLSLRYLFKGILVSLVTKDK